MVSPGNISRLLQPGDPQTASFEVAVSAHLERLLHSAHFDASARSREFLRFVVEETLAGRGTTLTQAVIAGAVFGRKRDFDSVFDPIVRVQAGRLRRSLERYYLLAGDTDAVHIELPRGKYAPTFQHTELDGNRVRPTVTRIASDVVPDWPTVVVHPFAVDSAEEDTAAHVKDTLTTELCRYGELRVIHQCDLDKLDPDNPIALRFELRGALRREGERQLIGMQLIDRNTGQQVWADEFLSAPRCDSVFSNLEDIARVIAARVGAEHGAIARVLAGEISGHCAESGCFSAIARCYRFLFSRHSSELVPTIEALRQLTQQAPELELGWTYLAKLYLANYSFELSPLHTPVEKAIGYAYEGVSLEPASAKARCTLATALLVKGELEAAREELQQALRLNADSLAYREVIGWLLALAGDWDKGMALMRETMVRNPYCLPNVKQALWADYLRRGEFDAAYIAALEHRDGSFFWRELMTTCCLGHLGREDEARASAAELLQAKPQFQERGTMLIGYYIKSSDLRGCVIEGLNKAGLVLS